MPAPTFELIDMTGLEQVVRRLLQSPVGQLHRPHAHLEGNVVLAAAVVRKFPFVLGAWLHLAMHRWLAGNLDRDAERRLAVRIPDGRVRARPAVLAHVTEAR